MTTLNTIIADYHNPQHAADLLMLLNSYAQDPMGGGQALKTNTQANLIAQLQQRSFCSSVLCYVDGKPAGFANLIEGFSTFKCQPLLNIHDFAILPEYRGQQLSQVLMQAIEDIAREKGCCKITLEVLSGNKIAQNAYLKAGFAGYELDPEMGQAMFWEKAL